MPRKRLPIAQKITLQVKKNPLSLLQGVVVILIGFISFSCSTSRTPNQFEKNPDFHIYLLMGQSNMAGRGVLTDSLSKLQNKQIWMLNRDNQWVIAHHPLHFDKPIAAVGPGLSFAMEMLKDYPNQQIGLVPCAVGGTSINKWQPGVADSATSTHPYDDAVERIQKAMQYGTVEGMLWLQGEADSNDEAIPSYLKKFEMLISQIRSLTKNENLPVVAGELGRFNSQYEKFNQELKNLPSQVHQSAVATSEGLADKGDHVHFDAASANQYGVRFAELMKNLQNHLPGR